MKIIAVVNNAKVGKTKINQLLSEYFSNLGKKVLVIDFDPKYDFSSYYFKKSIIFDIQKTCLLKSQIVSDPEATNIKNLDILIGCPDEMIVGPLIKRGELIGKLHIKLSEVIRKISIKRKYDIVFIDTNIGSLIHSIIKTATHIVIPTIMDAHATQGIYSVLQLWLQETLSRDMKEPLSLVGILPNMFKLKILHFDTLSNLKNDNLIGKYIMPIRLRYRAAFSNLDNKYADYKSVFTLGNNNASKKESLKVCSYISKKIFVENKI
jgi:cellulose biosynthesis protein BcsQ